MPRRSPTNPRALSTSINSGAILVLLATTVSVAGCGSGVRATFRATDASFAAQPGPAPQVYLYPADVPDLPWRSVGIVEVTVPGSAGLTAAVEAAGLKGKEVGCDALIEHSVFESMQARARFSGPSGARVVLVHGGSGSSVNGQSSAQRDDEPDETTRFDCVVAGESRLAI